MNGLANSAFAKVVFSIKKSFPFSIFNYSITKKANSKFLKFESNDEVAFFSHDIIKLEQMEV
ncbi:hypothetical protein LLID5_15350 [Lactococcus lactis]|nr:hypothetical protein LLID5_15350 [Lactococcus lactis]